MPDYYWSMAHCISWENWNNVVSSCLFSEIFLHFLDLHLLEILCSQLFLTSRLGTKLCRALKVSSWAKQRTSFRPVRCVRFPGGLFALGQPVFPRAVTNKAARTPTASAQYFLLWAVVVCRTIAVAGSCTNRHCSGGSILEWDARVVLFFRVNPLCNAFPGRNLQLSWIFQVFRTYNLLFSYLCYFLGVFRRNLPA